MIDLSIVIVSRNCRNALGRAMVSARKHTGGWNVETIVVDNASTDGSGQMVYRLYSNVQLIANGSDVGRARACNQGLQAAQGRYVLFLSPEAELTEECLSALAAVLESHSRVGACGARLSPEPREVPGGAFPGLWSRLLPPPASARLERRRATTLYRDREFYEVGWLPLDCLLVRREVVHQIGGPDERYRGPYLAIDWCLRMARAGWQRVAVPAAVARCAGGPAVGGVPAEAWGTRDEYLYWRLRKGWLATWLLLSLRLPGLFGRWGRLVMANLLARNSDAEIKGELRTAAARLGWHMRNGPRLLLLPARRRRAPRPPEGEAATP